MKRARRPSPTPPISPRDRRVFLARAIAAGATLAFLTAVKELPITMILRPTGFDTLAFELFDLLNEARHTLAAPMPLVMMSISFGVVWWAVGSRRAAGD